MFYIIKRDGRKQLFNRRKIENAIEKAFIEKDGELTEYDESKIISIADYIEKKCARDAEEFGKEYSVEEIQDLVENGLMSTKRKDVARAYIIYRNDRNRARGNNIDSEVEELLSGNSIYWSSENSNKNEELSTTQRDYMAGIVSTDLAKRKILPKDVLNAHNEGIIHVHDMDYLAQHMHNCFTGGTRFITNKGIRSFNSFKDGDSVWVKDLHGEFRIATVHKYEKQRMQKVTFSTGIMTREVICTPDHRWILQDGSVTTSLSINDRLIATPNSINFNISTLEEAESFCIGFVIGDGTDLKTNAVRVRLCGDKKKYSTIFELAGYRLENLSNTNDLIYYRKNSFKQDFINGKAWRFLPPQLQAFVFYGYYAADGASNANKLCTTDERLIPLIEETSGLAGYYISSSTVEVRDTNYKLNSSLYAYHFVTSQPSNLLWTVVNIEPDSHGLVDTWCVEEPITHSFTLEGGIVTGNCDLVNLEDMLQNGTVISETFIEKPHSFSTACNVATQIIAQVASAQYGGQSISLAALAPFVDISRQKIKSEIIEELEMTETKMSDINIDKIVEKRLKKEIQRGVQTIQYQVVTLMTTNGQAPFITVFMYLDEVEDGRTREDLAMIIEETLKQRIQGVKNEKGVWISPAFPKLIYCLDEDNIHEDSKYYYLTELAAKCSAKRLVPDYISAKLMKELKGDVYTCMGCRSFLTVDRFTEAGIGNIANAKNYIEGKHKYYGRFNQGVVTINLVDIACSSNKNMNKFWELFDERLELCYKALMCRHKQLLGTRSDVAPILWQYGALARLEKGEKIDKLLFNGYSTISLGYAGLYECVMYMTGKSHTDPEAKPFAIEVMQHMNDMCAKWKADTNIDFSLYGTPLESTTYKFAKALQRRFGIIENVTDHNYITNSYHINVRENISWKDKLSIESQFQKLSPGGAISYIETPNLQDNIPAVINMLKFMYENIMYSEINTKSDYCQVCGYNGEIKIKEKDDGTLYWECPNCGNHDENKLNVARRTCGYIGTQFWNQGRTQEIKDRVLHIGGNIAEFKYEL